MSTLDVTSYVFTITDPKLEKEKELQNQEKANKICRYIILTTLSNALFDIYCPYKTTTEIGKVLIRCWNSKICNWKFSEFCHV